jgi:membrane protease subunit HflK
MYLETMERLFGGTDKIILDSGPNGVVPYLPLNELMRPQPARPTTPASPQGSPQAASQAGGAR